MKRRRRILSVAVALMAIAVLNFIATNHFRLDEETPLWARSWNLVLSALLSFFLALGKNSARWIIVILTGLGTLAGFYALALLLAAGPELSSDKDFLRLNLILIVINLIANAFICWFLTFSPGVSREIRRIAEQID